MDDETRTAAERRLRSAAFVAADAGLTETEIMAIVQAGITEARAMQQTRDEADVAVWHPGRHAA